MAGFKQVYISAIASFSLVASGMSLGFPAISLKELEHSDNLTGDETSWFTSVLSIATVFGCLLCGPLLDAFGRKNMLMFMNIPFIVGWIILCVMPRPAPLALLFFARVVTGIGCGMVSIPACVYIGEISNKKIRGMLVTWPSCGMAFGILLVYLIGWAIQDDWRVVAGIIIAMPILTIVLVFIFLKESPHWLLSRGRESEAEVSFRWIREVGEDEKMPDAIREEFDAIVENARKRAEKQVDSAPQISTVSNIMEDNPTFSTAKPPSLGQRILRPVTSLGSSDVWKPLVILNLYFFFMMFGGIQVVAAYALGIMTAAGVTIGEYEGSVLLGAVQLIGGIGASFAFNSCGRRPLTLISGTGMAVTMIGLGIYLEVGDDSNELSWLSLVLILGYIGFAAIGFNLLPWSLVGELYPSRVAGLAGGLTTCIGNLMSFAAMKMYPAFQEAVTTDTERSGGVFFFFGVVSGVGTIFLLFFLPETFKKSLQQIGEEFRNATGLKFQCF